jgi:hypothetical protein
MSIAWMSVMLSAAMGSFAGIVAKVSGAPTWAAYSLSIVVYYLSLISFKLGPIK